MEGFVKLNYEQLSEQEVLRKSQNFYELMNQRRSIRTFSDKKVEREVLLNLIKTAGTAPSGAHKQPWTFCLIESDEYKVSGEWIFESETGDVVTLYDWKSTDLYDTDLPSVEEFRQESRYDFHVGAKDKMTALMFNEWFMNQITPKIEG